MHILIPAVAVLVSLGFGGDAKSLTWKRVDSGPGGAVRLTDSLTYDAKGKLLAEYRADPSGQPIHSIQYLYDDSGRCHQAIKYSPEEHVIGETRCAYQGDRLTGWTRTDDNILMDGLTFQKDDKGRRIAYFQAAMARYRFVLDGRGRAESVTWQGGTEATGTFGYDAAGKHATTRFTGADGAFLGRDTLLRNGEGAVRELRRYAADGKLFAKLEYRYDARNELTGKTFEKEGVIQESREYILLPADSLGKLNRSSSAWKDSTRTPICDFSWFRHADFGFEPASLAGLSLPQAAKSPPAIPAWQAMNDSLERERRESDASFEATKAMVGKCRLNPNRNCLGQARSTLRDMANRRPKGHSDLEAIDTLAGLLLDQGGDTEYARLLAEASSDTAIAATEQRLIDRLLDYQVKKAYADFCFLPAAAGDSVVRFKADSVGPGGVLTKEWQVARDYHLRLTRHKNRPTQSDTAESDRWTYGSIYRNVLDFLQTRNAARLDTLARFQWDGWCGTGSEALYGPKGKVGLLHDLERGDLIAALQGSTDMEAQRRLLICRSADWELFFLGAAVHRDSDIRGGALRIIAQHGSVAAFRRLLQLPPVGYLEDGMYFPGLVEAWGAGLLGPGARLPLGEGRWKRPDLLRDPKAPALPSDLKSTILERLTALIDSMPFNLDELTLVRILSRAEFPRRADYLQRLAAVPNPQSRNEAVAALRKIGVEARNLPPLEPVTFEVTSRGKPFPDGSFSLALPCPPSAAECPPWGVGSSIYGGRYALDRKSYLHARHSARSIRFFYDYPGFDDFRDSRLFSLTLPLEENPGGPVRVDIPLYRREYHLLFPPGFEADPAKQMRVLIRPLTKDARGYARSVSLGLRRRLVLPALGEGSYTLALATPGLRTWVAESLRVGSDAADTLRFGKGCDMEFRIRQDSVGEIRVPVSVTLRHEGSGPVRRDPFSLEDRPAGPALGDTDYFRGLAPGRYTLEVSALPDSTRGARPARAVKTFTVTKDSPPVIRLGDIRLR